MTAATGEAEFGLRLELSFADEEDPEEDRADVVERASLGFLFVIGYSSSPTPGLEAPPICTTANATISGRPIVAALRHGELYLDTDCVRAGA